MSQYSSVLLQTTVDKPLGNKVKTAARKEGLSISSYIRRILTLYHDPDSMMLHHSPTLLVDSRATYETEEE